MPPPAPCHSLGFFLHGLISLFLCGATAALNETTRLCERPVPNRAAIVPGITGWFAGFTSVFVIGRLATKVARLSQWGFDDTAIVIVWVCKIKPLSRNVDHSGLC